MTIYHYMIISHKYKFIFIKPSKVGGTSIEIALAKHCGEQDIITPLHAYNPKHDEDKFLHLSKNYKEKEFFQHITPEDIKKKIGDNIWNNYFKFTVVRNPWDQTVSRYWWRKYKDRKKILSNVLNFNSYKTTIVKILQSKNLYYFFKKSKKNELYYFYKKLNPNFEYFATTFSKTYPNKHWKNALYYFDKKGNPVCNFYIRYENLQKDYKKVCKRLGIPCEKLPKTKNKIRKDKRHYSLYYNDGTRKIIYNLFKKEIDYFSYKFEKV